MCSFVFFTMLDVRLGISRIQRKLSSHTCVIGKDDDERMNGAVPGVNDGWPANANIILLKRRRRKTEMSESSSLYYLFISS